MIFNYKKIASVLASAIMLSSTIGFAAAANYPAPFVSGGTAHGAVIVGANAAITDWSAAIDVSQKLNALVTTSSSSTGSTASGGDSVNLATSARKLYYGDTLNVARTAISNSDLPNVLTDNKFTDLSGTQYSYTQTIVPGPATITFGTSGGDLSDPVLYIDGGNSGALTAGWLYNYTLTFSKNVNVSDSVNVQGQKIKMLGVDYVIGSGSTNSTLYLYGSGETVVVKGGEESKVTIAGTEHTVELVTTSSTTAGTIKVDGVSKSVIEGSPYAFAGNLNIFVKDIIHPAYAGDIRQAELIIGSNTLVVTNGATVKQGADLTSIKSTLGTVSAAGHGIISGFSVAIGMPATKTDSIVKGGSFTDPVFGGLKVQFATVAPDLTDESRDKIVVNTDNTQYGYVTFTSAKAGDKGEQKITYAYDNDTTAATIQPLLAHSTVTSNKGRIHVLENETALENDWIVVNQGDAGTILQVESISVDTATAGKVVFTDAITGAYVPDSTGISLVNTTGMYTRSGVTLNGGTGYTVSVNAAGTQVSVGWSSGATKTLFPRIKLKGGGWLAFLTETSITNATSVIFPDGQTSLTTTGTAVSNSSNTTNPGAGIIFGQRVVDNSNGVYIQNLTNPTCNFNVTKGPAILLIEPKRWNDATAGNFICVPMTTTGTTEIAIARAVMNGTAPTFTSFTSDNYKSATVDQYGAFVTDEQRTNENGVATITYPASQMYADILFTAEAATVTPGTAGSGSGGQVLVVKDSEVDSVKAKNLFVVGGSCINSVAAKILGSDVPVCGADFSAQTKVSDGGYIIKTVESPYDTTKVAMLVAGFNAEDTQNAVTKALSGVATDKDTSTTYPEVATAA